MDNSRLRDHTERSTIANNQTRRGVAPRSVAVNADPAAGAFDPAACKAALTAAVAPFLARWIREWIDSGDLVVIDHTVHVKDKR